MDEYVKKEDVVLALLDKGQRSTRYNWGESWELNLFEIRESIDYMKSEDVEPVRHGRWIETPTSAYCSNCHVHWAKSFIISLRRTYKYCPQCGAKMDGGVKSAEQQDETDNDSETG